jgi:hypothetical protein
LVRPNRLISDQVGRDALGHTVVESAEIFPIR